MLTEQRLNELAVKALSQKLRQNGFKIHLGALMMTPKEAMGIFIGKLEKDGIYLKPTKIVEEITEMATSIGVDKVEAIEFAMHVIELLYLKTMAALNEAKETPA